MAIAQFLILVAIVANVLTNLFLKQLVGQFDLEAGWGNIWILLTSKWLWLTGISGLTLLGSFAASLKWMSLPIAYASVIGGAIIVLQAVTLLTGQESFNLAHTVGIGFVVLGIAIINLT